MKNIMTVFVLGLLLNSTSALAESAGSEPGVFDTVLADGMTIAQTLEEWDRSAMRYRSEPPELELDEQSSVEQEDPKPNDDGKQS